MSEVPQQKKSMFDNVPPKFTFAFGLVIGIAAFSLFGYISLLSSVNGDTTSTNSAKTTETTVADNVNGSVAGDTVPTGNDAVGDVSVKPVADTEYIRGNADAKITVVEYSDLECPYCTNFHDTMMQIMEKYPNDVKWVYRHFPLSFHPNAQKQAEGAECAAELGGGDAFWTYIDNVFEKGTTEDGLADLASEMGLNKSQFQSCLDSDTYADKVESDLTDGTLSGVTGTPTSFILDESGSVAQSIPGALPFSQVDQVISELL